MRKYILGFIVPLIALVSTLSVTQISNVEGQTNSTSTPYISRVNPNPAISGQLFTINGQRLTSNIAKGVQNFPIVLLDGYNVLNYSVVPRVTLNGADDGTSISFILPSLGNGSHTVQITDAYMGTSNTFVFKVGEESTVPSIKVIYPASGQEYRIGDKINVLWQSNVLDATYQYILLENTAIKNLGIVVTNNLSSSTRLASFVFSQNTLNSFLANSGGLTEEQLRNNYYVRVVAIKRGLIFNSAVAHNAGGTFSVLPAIFSTSTPVISATSTPVVTNTAISIRAIDNGVNAPVSATIGTKFTITALDKDIYVSRSWGGLLDTVFQGESTDSSKLFIGSVTPQTVAGDTAAYYVIRAGTSRMLTVEGTLFHTGGAGLKGITVKQIFYGTSPSNLMEYSITRGLENLKASIYLGRNDKDQGNATTTRQAITLSPSVINKTIKLGESIDFLFIVNESNEMTKGSWDRWFIGKGDFPPGLAVKQFGAFSGQLIGKPTKAGSFTFMINAENTGTGGSTSALVNLTVTVSPAPSPSPLTATCTGSDMNNLYVQWTAFARGGTGIYEYQWSVYNDVASYVKGSTQSNSFMNQYRSTGVKEAVVIVTDGKTRTSATCRVSLMMRAYPTMSPAVPIKPLYTTSPSPAVSSSPSPAVSAYPYPTTSASPTVSPVVSPTASPAAIYTPSTVSSPSPSPSPTYSASPSPTYSPSPSPTYSTSPSPSSSPTSMIGDNSYQRASIWDAIKEALMGW